jgi:tetratricopeptide (TPR) repeat protein
MTEAQAQKIPALEKKVGTGGKSPLFAQLASFYIQQGKAQEALRLCDEGLAVFPHYTTGHLVKGKALLALSMNAEARREFEIVHGFLPANETVSFILSNIQPGEGESLTTPPAEVPSIAPSADEGEPTATQTEPQQATDSFTPAPTMTEETTPNASTGDEPVQPSNFFEAVAENAQATDDPFGIAGTGGGDAITGTEEPPAEENVNPFEGFPMQAESPEAAQDTPAADSSQGTSIFDFPFQSDQQPAVDSGEESFDMFSSRMRGELGGTENTLTLEEYLASSTGQTTATEGTSGDTIEDLAEKLQSAKKITPVINLTTRTTIPASETDTPASTGFVTPTLAEIYAKQGWYDDAIKAYHTLIVTKPAEKERFEKRIAELEELKKQQS